MCGKVGQVLFSSGCLLLKDRVVFRDEDLKSLQSIGNFLKLHLMCSFLSVNCAVTVLCAVDQLLDSFTEVAAFLGMRYYEICATWNMNI